MVCKTLHNQSPTFVLAWSFLTPLCMSPQALVILNCLKFTLCNGVLCFYGFASTSCLECCFHYPRPTGGIYYSLSQYSVFSVRFISSAMLLLTDSPFCGAILIPTFPPLTPQVALELLVPVQCTCHMIPGQQFYPVPFWTALIQSRHLMNNYWLKERMINKSNLSSWVWLDKNVPLKNKILTE